MTSLGPEDSSEIVTPNQDWVSMDIDKFGKSFYSNDDSPLNEQIKLLKLKTLQEYLINNKSEEIIEYLRSADGLLNNDLRKNIWPILLRINEGNTTPSGSDTSIFVNHEASVLLDELSVNDCPLHKDEDQVSLDIRRSFSILNHIRSSLNTDKQQSCTYVYTNDEINHFKTTLFLLIVKLLRKYPSLSYYQGFHDIGSVIIVVCFDKQKKKVDEHLAFQLLECLALNHLRDFMITDMSLSINHLKLIPAVLEIVDHKFFKLIKQLNHTFINSGGSYYDYGFYQGLSSILTMFSHDIKSLDHLLIVWDFSLSYNSILIDVYIYIAALIHKKSDLFNRLNIDNEIETFDHVDKDELHNLISPSSLFKDLNDNSLIKILNNAKFYYENYPINKLSNSSFTFDIWFKQYNKNSVLLTTSSAFDDGKDLMLINNPTRLDELILIQDNEMSNLSSYNLSVEKKLYDINDELLTDYDQTGSNLLSSSLSSLQSSTSSLNSKILKTSSVYFKKLLFSDAQSDSELTEGNTEKNMSPKRNSVFKLSTIYKISITVGFIGFLIHFFLSKHSNLITHYGNKVTHDCFHFLKTSQVINNSFSAGKIGLGNLRNSIYGYIG